MWLVTIQLVLYSDTYVEGGVWGLLNESWSDMHLHCYNAWFECFSHKLISLISVSNASWVNLLLHFNVAWPHPDKIRISKITFCGLVCSECVWIDALLVSSCIRLYIRVHGIFFSGNVADVVCAARSWRTLWEGGTRCCFQDFASKSLSCWLQPQSDDSQQEAAFPRYDL